MLRLLLRFLFASWLLLILCLALLQGIRQINPSPILAYLSDIAGRADIMLADAETGIVVNITQYEGRDGDISWSLDGRYLVYRSSRESLWDFFVLDTQNWQIREIQSFQRETYFYWLSANEILFTDSYSQQETAINLETGEILSNYESKCNPFCGTMSLPNYKPVLSLVNGEVQVEPEAIDWTIENFGSIESLPIQSHDRQWFAFFSSITGQNALYRSRAEGGIAERLTYVNAPNSTPVWSHDGRWITFTDYVDGRQDVFVVEVASHQLYNISHSPLPDYNGIWQP